uniref:Uncharacterized protein n=1 Tax=Tanacetum cinerariifolium TaxID=118510 RepID=A0A6L2MD91_TANCI|nr:hypothetical protein [Tanacetum cinerariifolium]
MAQQPQRDVPQDQLCPPNKRFDLIHANKKFDLVNLQCPNESKILVDFLNNHPLRLCIAASAFVPLIYIHQLWYTLKIDDAKDIFKFFLDTKELTLTLADFRRMESYQQKVNLTAPTIIFPGIERNCLPSILNRVLEMLKKYNKDVKYGYADPSPNDADAEYLPFFKEYIKDRLKHHDQMRR